MKRFTVITVMAIVLMACITTVSAVDLKIWKEVGVNPTTTSLNETLKKMSLTDQQREFVKNNFPDAVYIDTAVFVQGSEGNAEISSPVRTEYSGPVKALVWHTGQVDIYMILECNNVVWTPACPEYVPAEPIAPIIEVENVNEGSGGIPGWFQTLFWIVMAILLVLFALWALGRFVNSINTNHPAPTTTTTPQPAPPAPVEEEQPEPVKPEPAAIETVTIPAEKPDKLTQLENLREDLASKQQEVTDLEGQVTDLENEIRGVLDGRSEENTEPTA